MEDRILITICARGGSKGIPGKNIKLLNGKPLIEYTIAVANEFALKNNAKIALSTDNLDIINVAEKLGLKTDYIRPKILSTDLAGKADTINDLIHYEETTFNTKFKYILDLDVTSPLRTYNDLTTAFSIFKSGNVLSLFSVNPSARNPYFNMVEKKENGYYGLIKTNIDGTVLSRQCAPQVYDLNASFYWYKRDFFEMKLKSAITDRSTIYEMPHICFDLDHPIDFDFLEYLIINKKIDILC